MKCKKNCHECCNFICGTVSIETIQEVDSLVIDVPFACLRNGKKFCIGITSKMPDFGTRCPAEVPVVVRIADKEAEDAIWPILTEHCTCVYSNKLKPRLILHCTSATDTHIFCCHDKHAQWNVEHSFPAV